MKIKYVSFFIMVFIFMVSSIGTVTAANPTYETSTSNQCSTPTENLFISADKSSITYNTSTLTASKNTCVAIDFTNPSSLDHTFSIDAISSDNVTYFNIFVKAGTNGTSNFLTPNVDVTLKYYCQVPGHEQDGMYGSLIVGKGSSTSSPGFELPIVIVSMFAVVAIVKFYKMKRIQ